VRARAAADGEGATPARERHPAVHRARGALLVLRDRVRGLRVNADRICGDLDPHAIQATQKRDEGLWVVVRENPAYQSSPATR
jgi:hypothetical protein